MKLVRYSPNRYLGCAKYFIVFKEFNNMSLNLILPQPTNKPGRVVSETERENGQRQKRGNSVGEGVERGMGM